MASKQNPTREKFGDAVRAMEKRHAGFSAWVIVFPTAGARMAGKVHAHYNKDSGNVTVVAWLPGANGFVRIIGRSTGFGYDKVQAVMEEKTFIAVDGTERTIKGEWESEITNAGYILIQAC